ncbi:maleylpyruvate isomerase family mycothiol-dependent enzyme [Acrocarpospora catenulata]|uniref:maleylpyruvate isomerase family mycothiol-dependent enzyme n=1 Tax=Acrocarpospora catenulata TaxID=2836182 RepID=UPI001BDA99C6|nr:maleylpyruvate isomerase family mycothiol-dependent enzyme [Acrocarpospora catenulata]
MSESVLEAVRLPRTGREQSAEVGEAEGRAAVALLEKLGDGDWRRPTDCPEWDVRDMVAHLVAQCEDNIHLGTLIRRELVGRVRHRGKIALDGHMAAQLDDHVGEAGPVLVERFAQLWPRAVRARRGRPGALRSMRIPPGVPGVPMISLGYLLDVIYNRDLWMHRVDLARAAGLPVTIGEHDRLIVEQVVRDLALAWSGAPVTLELTGPAGGSWLVGAGEPVAVVRADTVAYMRALAGRDDDVALELVSGTAEVLPSVRAARVIF